MGKIISKSRLGALLLIFVLLEYLFTPAAQWLGLRTPCGLGEILGFQKALICTGSGALYFSPFLHVLDSFPMRKAVRPEIGSEVAVYLLITFLAMAGLPFLRERSRKVLLILAGSAVTIFIYGPWATALYLGLQFLIHSWIFSPHPASRATRWLCPLLPISILAAAKLGFGANVYGTAALLGPFILAWQVFRIVCFLIDMSDGLVPEDLPFTEYLFLFLNPATVVGINIGVYMPMAYGYLQQKRDERLVFEFRAAGRILLPGLFFLIAYRPMQLGFQALLELAGVEVSGRTELLLQRWQSTAGMLSAGDVYFSAVATQAFEYFYFAGICHYQVGLWRLMGYEVEPMFQRPWMARNLVDLFGRFQSYMRTFLLQSVYYPVFFSLKRWPLRLRAAVSIVAAAGIANFSIHFYKNILFTDLEFQVLPDFLRRWPYYTLLTLGILVSVSAGSFFTGIVNRRGGRGLRAAYGFFCWLLTISFFSLIHLFSRNLPGISLSDELHLLGRVFGL